MTSNVMPLTALPRLDEDAWDDLINYIEERRVIPIVGPELLRVETDSGPRLLYDWMAEKLAAKLGVDTSRLPEAYTLNDVVCWFLSTHGRRLAMRRKRRASQFEKLLPMSSRWLCSSSWNSFSGVRCSLCSAHTNSSVSSSEITYVGEAEQRPNMW